MLQDAPHTTSAANWHAKVQPPRLIEPISLAGLALAVVIVLALLYPQQRLSDQIRQNIQIDEISLQYIKSLLATEPDNYELRLQLAQAYASIGQYQYAFETLDPLYTNTDAKFRETAWLTKLNILLKIAYEAKPDSVDRHEKMQQFRLAVYTSKPQISDDYVLQHLSRIAQTGGELQLKEYVAARFAISGYNVKELDEAARVALGEGHYLISAQFTWRARQISADSKQKIIYLQLALTTLQSGNIGYIGLDWVQQLPVAEWNSAEVLYSLTKLALASNRPALAALFATKLVGFDYPSGGASQFNSTHYELAYIAFLGNQDLPLALKLSQIAVRKNPDSAIWRERLAHTAEWSGQPQLAIVEWRWLALHRGKESDWQAWMRLAGALFDYDAQIIGLERDWRQNGEGEKYARKIVQLYEYLGQPEDALAWLDRHGDEVRNPALLLLSAELLTSMGREEDALKYYRRYLSRNLASPDLAITMAVLLQLEGKYQEAFDVLVISQPQATRADTLFWSNLGELAWILKQYDEAEIAYRHLSDAPDADINHQIRLFQVLKQNNPRLAAKTAEHYWLINGRIELFMSAVDTYAALNDWQELQRLYKLADKPEWRDYEENMRFLSVRAEMHKNTGNFLAAEHDYRLLTMRYPGDLAIKESYLWLLVDTLKLNQLDVLMQKWSSLLPKAPTLWDVFAAGHLVLGRPSQALIMYDSMLKSHINDNLWLLNYAATLEATGQDKRAKQIRSKIWQKNSSKLSNSGWLNTRANANDIESLRLLLLNDPSLGQTILWKLLRDGSPELKQNSQFVELATLWLNDHGQNDASRAWLIRQYARRLNTPK